MIQNEKFLGAYIFLKSRFVEFFKKNLIYDLNLISKDYYLRIPLIIDKLWTFDPVLTKKLLKNPSNYIPIIDHAVYTVYKNFDYFKKNKKVVIKSSIQGPFGNRICHLKNLKAHFIGEIVCLRGFVVKYTEIKIKIEQSVHFSSKTGKFFVNKFKNSKRNNCWYYNFKDENMNNLEIEYGLCKFVNWQSILLQNYSKDYKKEKHFNTVCAILENDLINTCSLGNLIEICGIYSPFVMSRLNVESDFFSPGIFVLSVKNLNEFYKKNLNQFDYFLMKNFSLLANSFKKLSLLIAPQILGQNFIKKTVLLFLTGGNSDYNRYSIHKFTSINLLLMSDSSKIKSEFLFFISKLFPSSIFLNGGTIFLDKLKIKIEKKAELKEHKQELNQIFFVDKKILCLNNLEKINKNEKKIIKEIIDRQTISVEKNGLMFSLKARCNVLGLTNFIINSGDNLKDLKKNSKMFDEIKNRFDLRCFLLENISVSYDRKLASFILKQHQYIKTKPASQSCKKIHRKPKNCWNFCKIKQKNTLLKKKKKEQLPFYFFKIYIDFLKKNIKPLFSTIAGEYFLKRYKKEKDQKTKKISMNIKNFEILIKMAFSFTKCHLRSIISEKDINFCFIFLNKILQSEQKILKKTKENFQAINSKLKKKEKKKSSIYDIFYSETNKTGEKNWKISNYFKHTINKNFKKIIPIKMKIFQTKQFLSLKKKFFILEKLISIMIRKKTCLIFGKKIIKI